MGRLAELELQSGCGSSPGSTTCRPESSRGNAGALEGATARDGSGRDFHASGARCWSPPLWSSVSSRSWGQAGMSIEASREVVRHDSPAGESTLQLGRPAACKALGLGVWNLAVGEWVLEVDEGGAVRRETLASGLTRVGGQGCEITLARAGADQLHVWDAPPKLVFVGK